jgi:two-component system nitrogen regulation response regulator NtrX
MGMREKEHKVDAHRLGRRRILVAEEDGQNRRLLASALRADGYEVVEAANGFDLLEQLSAALVFGDLAGAPDAIIMDLWMHGVSGLSIVDGLRDAEWPTPVVLISKDRGHERREELSRFGAHAVFQEPFDIDDLRTVILNLVPASGRRSIRPAASAEAKLG